MPKSKLDFIRDLLVNHKLPDSEKERFFRLASKELKQYDDRVWKELEGLKKEIDKIKKPKSNHEGRGKEKQNFPIVHNPQRVVNILDKFTSEKPLKDATHKWHIDEYGSYSQFINKISQSYNKIHNNIKKHKSLYAAKIKSFLLNREVGVHGWGYDRIKIGWSSPELARWCKDNPDESPFDFPLPKNLRNVKDKNLRYFGDAVDVFKDEIEIREEGDKLNSLISEIIDEKELFDYFSPNLKDGLIGKRFFTDVQWFKFSLHRIFDNIKDRNKYKNFEVDVISTDNESSLTLRIVHINSYSKHTSFKKEKKFENATGDLGSIVEKMENLADFSIESIFKEGPKRLNYLTSNKETLFIEDIETCRGFTHNLKFYKSR